VGIGEMARFAVQEQIAQAERLVAFGELLVSMQHERVAELEQLGRDAAGAKLFLAEFENLRRAFLTERNQLQKRLKEQLG
jgi:hypothetical protein